MEWIKNIFCKDCIEDKKILQQRLNFYINQTTAQEKVIKAKDKMITKTEIDKNMFEQELINFRRLYDKLKEDYNTMITTNRNLYNSVSNIQDYGEPPEFLDVRGDFYNPKFQFVEHPTGNSKCPTIAVKRVEHPEDMYYVTETIRDIVLTKGWLELESDEEKCMAIWKYISQKSVRQYRFDYGDNCQLAFQTLDRKWGDCEDSSFLFLTLGRASGVSPQRLFLAVGNYYRSYHAFPILVNLEKEKVYVYESTTNHTPRSPKILGGGNYHVHKMGGIQNWAFRGNIKDEYKQMFNWSD